MKIKTNTYAELGKFSKREQMVHRQLEARGIRDRQLLDAFLTVPRHIFVPEESRERAYQDGPLSIGHHQTISQPYVVALMLEELRLKPAMHVLEIGSGSGYVCALLSLMVRRVTGIELEKELVTDSIRSMNALSLKNVRIYQGNGYEGYPPQAPYDAIIVSAAPPTFPEDLLRQLKPSGRMIIPVGEAEQELFLYRQVKGSWKAENITEVRFVPLRAAPGSLATPADNTGV